ncbi:MAG: metallophosphoesterase [Clostridia bacterium]|nr:metallophosphoesterase [Clostridia bacterium]
MPRRYRARHARPRKLLRAILISLLSLLAVFLVILPAIEPHWYQVDQTTLPMEALSKDVKRLRIVFVSDIHEDGAPYFTYEDTKGLVSRINALNPDLVLLGGDYTANPEGTADFFSRLPEIKTNYGVYAVLGEHDRSASGFGIEELRKVTKNRKITLLVNETASVRIGPSTLYICGLDDAVNGSPSASAVASSVSQDDLVILLAHNPGLIESAREATDRNGKRGNWFDLGLFGHTHGGQIALLGDALGLYGDIPEGHRRGWFMENRVPMLVSTGVGTSVIPARLLCRPQIHLITLTSE